MERPDSQSAVADKSPGTTALLSTDTTTKPDTAQSKKRYDGFFSSQAFSFLSLTCQLGVVILAIWRFQIEDARGLPALLPLIFGGFIVHYLLPKEYRRPFFLLLSIAGIFVVLPFPQSLI